MIKCIKLQKYYNSADNLCKAVDGITLHINKGEFVSIIGKSGAGKSTLLHLIGGIDTPTSGNIFIDNQDISLFSDSQKACFRRNKIGFIFQNFALINKYSVLENILIPLSFTKLKEKEKKERATKLLKDLGIADLANKIVYKLSGGEKQRVAIGRALINNPDIILADEPTGSLDSTNTEYMMKILKEMNNKGKIIILITHDNDIAMHGDRMIELLDGRIINETKRPR